MRVLITLILILTIASCDSMEAESSYNKKSWELKEKNAELDYLERLYRVRKDIEFQEKLRVIDSLIDNQVNH